MTFARVIAIGGIVAVALAQSPRPKGAVAIAAAPSPTAPSAAAPVPDEVLYYAFFFRVAWFDKIARQQAARGKDGASLRSAIRREAALTLAEEETLKAAAGDCRDKVASLVAAVRAEKQSGAKFDAAAASAQWRQIVLDHVAQLRALGPAPFQKLDSYIRRTVRATAPAAR